MDTDISIDFFDELSFSKEYKFMLVGSNTEQKHSILNLITKYIDRYPNRTVLTLDTEKIDLYACCQMYRKYSPLLNKRILSQNYINFILFDDIPVIKNQIIDFYKLIDQNRCLFIDIAKELQDYMCKYDYIFIFTDNEVVLQKLFQKYPVKNINNFEDFSEIIFDCLDNNEIAVIDNVTKELLYFELE